MAASIEELRRRIASIESGAGNTRAHARQVKPQKESCSSAVAFSDSPHPVPGSGNEDRFSYRSAMKKIERLAAVREQASVSLQARLVRDGFSEAVASQAVTRACECGLVDDARYADVLVRSRLAQGRGVPGIERELSKLSIDPSQIEQLREADDTESELSRALSLLERKPPRAKNKRDAAYRRLVQKGYSSAVASSAARHWTEALEAL